MWFSFVNRLDMFIPVFSIWGNRLKLLTVLLFCHCSLFRKIDLLCDHIASVQYKSTFISLVVFFLVFWPFIVTEIRT